jgi:predicted alpha/beta-hydrolase family hydrolase
MAAVDDGMRKVGGGAVAAAVGHDQVVTRASRRADGLVLFPGAGASADHSALVAVERVLDDDGVPVARVDFPYRLAGRRGPDRPPVLIGAVVAAAGTWSDEWGVAPRRLGLGGRSMGGRMCSMAVAQGLPAAALVLISYPLHPPGRPGQLRTEHFGDLHVPCLFVSGTRDAFGTPDELVAASAAIPGPVTHEWIEGGDHGLRRRDELVAGVVRSWIRPG